MVPIGGSGSRPPPRVSVRQRAADAARLDHQSLNSILVGAVLPLMVPIGGRARRQYGGGWTAVRGIWRGLG